MQKITPEYLASQGLSKNFPERFFSKIQITDSCWLWMAWRLPRGYGLVSRGGRGNGMELAHRASWILHFGPIPAGCDVCHDCPNGDNPSCVNPAHLFTGTRSDNMMDCSSKGGKLGQAAHPLPGELNPFSKFTNQQVEQIRNAYIPRYGNLIAMARKYGVHRETIRRIICGKHY